MVNIWSTYCDPCLKEMPILAEINKSYKSKGVQVIGMVLDAVDSYGNISKEKVSDASRLVKENEGIYTHLVPDKGLLSSVLCSISSFPETVFVDNKGKIVGESYTGTKDKASWETIIDITLNEVKK